MDINTIVRENLKTLMNQKKVSVNDIVEKYDIAKSTLYTYLLGTRKISLNKLDILKEALNVSFSLILSKNFYNINKNCSTDHYALYTNGRYFSHLTSEETLKRGQTIHYYRVLASKKKTLQELGTMFNICRERVRQIQKEIVQRKLNEQTREWNSFVIETNKGSK